MSSKTKKLTATGAASAIPSGNAFPTVDANGTVTMVSGSLIPAKSIVKSSVTPATETEWLRVAKCNHAPCFAMLSVVGTYAAGHGDGFPTLIAFGFGGIVNVVYTKGRIFAIVKSGTVSKVRAVYDKSNIYIDIQFEKGGGTPTISLIGANNVELLTPSIAPTNTPEADTYIYEL